MEGEMAERINKVMNNKQNACYVLITCEKPQKDGRMQVEMTYEGDPCLAAYLVESAQDIFHQQLSCEGN